MTAEPTYTSATARPTYSPAEVELTHALNRPMAARGPATYQREFVDHYVPNESWLMPRDVAEELRRLGHRGEAQPADINARDGFAQSLVELSWNSSRLEGNRYSLQATEELLNGGSMRCDVDTVMLLNHKAAVDFLVDSLPQEGLTTLVVRNLHALLIQDLNPDSCTLGAIRNSRLGIAGTLYSPMQGAVIIEAMLESIVEKATCIENPAEAALFLWIQLAYLQPFEHGNEATSRLAANIPLLLHNCAPLTFQDVTRDDYARAMLAVYEFRNAALAAELFSWAYQRSVSKYVAASDARRLGSEPGYSLGDKLRE
ncbi:Fic family protein [Ralstonia pseudosolanacearum]|uniref:Fic family protein n=1 Tax=Ralstonia pseudosolanacearum TaxID=1310165 RepID=UPI0018D0B64D|nr:Fic family protein [Ralstonia pseudosolanacearum]